MTIPESTTSKNGEYTASLSYRAPFPLDFWGILSSGMACKVRAESSSLLECFAEPQPTFALQMAYKVRAESSSLLECFAEPQPTFALQMAYKVRAESSSLLECFAEPQPTFALQMACKVRAESSSLLECFAEPQPTFAKQISESTERRTCDAGSGTHCWQSAPLLLGIKFPLFPIFARRMSATARKSSSKLGSSLALHSISDDKYTHTPSARRCPREAKLSRRAELRRWILSDLFSPWQSNPASSAHLA
jgi:hypothetical protein